MQKEIGHYWYANWFDTPFYHILYKDRDRMEAQEFMNHLTTFLELPLHSEVLDLACGKGRHSIYLNHLGYKVIGADLSEKSINFARQFENESLQFEVHDMSLPFTKKFDAIFNLFTSFGYFENEADNLRTIRAIKEGLKKGGHGVIDFFNVDRVMEQLVPEETKIVDGISFHIIKYIKEGYILKDIEFTHEGNNYKFTEKVKALTLSNFKEYFREAGATLRHCFGDYQLNPFDVERSDRLILIFD